MIDTNALSIVDIEQGAGPRVLSPNDPFNLLRASRLLVSDFLAQLSVSYLSASLKAVDLLFDVLSDAFPVVRTRWCIQARSENKAIQWLILVCLVQVLVRDGLAPSDLRQLFRLHYEVVWVRNDRDEEIQHANDDEHNLADPEKPDKVDHELCPDIVA